jgi:hypothetical protein
MTGTTPQCGRRTAQPAKCSLPYVKILQYCGRAILRVCTTIEDAVRTRARQVALRDLGRVSHTMKLENQADGDADLEMRIETYIRDVLKDRDLWAS